MQEQHGLEVSMMYTKTTATSLLSRDLSVSIESDQPPKDRVWGQRED